jgi:hypothetical protein
MIIDKYILCTYIDTMDIEILETPFFRKQVKKEKISETDVISFKEELVRQPERGDLIPQSGGLRKIRVKIEGKGKRGGARVIYLYIVAGSEIYLLHIYKKTRKDDLTRDELKTLRGLAQLLMKKGK